jgi:hypothetical protein
MKFKLFCVCSLFVFAAASTPAQTKGPAGTCAKSTNMQTIDAGDQQGHVFAVQSATCTPTTEVHGAKATSAGFAEHDDMTATRAHGWGVYTETFDSGDKLFYSYHTTAVMKDGALVSGSNTYSIIGGTGKMKGVHGSGSCKLKGTADGGVAYNCTSAGAGASTEKKSE